MRFGDFAGVVVAGPVIAQVINLDGRMTIRLKNERGIHLGYFTSVEAVVAAGFDLADVTIGV